VSNLTDDNEGTVAEQLMNALISKMEVMDSNLQVLKAENEVLKGLVGDPAALLKKAGFVSRKTASPVDVMPDLFRGDSHFDILKNDNGSGLDIPATNQEFHEMDWGDIHRLAAEAKTAGALGNQSGIE
jgi:hypothetical protein